MRFIRDGVLLKGADITHSIPVGGGQQFYLLACPYHKGATVEAKLGTHIKASNSNVFKHKFGVGSSASAEGADGRQRASTIGGRTRAGSSIGGRSRAPTIGGRNRAGSSIGGRSRASSSIGGGGRARTLSIQSTLNTSSFEGIDQDIFQLRIAAVSASKLRSTGGITGAGAYVYIKLGTQTALTRAVRHNAKGPYFGQEFTFSGKDVSGEEEVLLQVYSQAKSEPRPQIDGVGDDLLGELNHHRSTDAVGDDLLGELKLSLAHIISGEEVTKPLIGETAKGTLTFRVALMGAMPAEDDDDILNAEDELPRGHGRRLTIDANNVHENPLASAATRIQRLSRQKSARQTVQRMRERASMVDEGDEGEEDEDSED
jgi:hypothetical protein